MPYGSHILKISCYSYRVIFTYANFAFFFSGRKMKAAAHVCFQSQFVKYDTMGINLLYDLIKKWRPLCNRAIMVPRGWELIFHRLLLFLLSWFFGSNIDRIISKSLGEKNNGFPLSSSCFRSFCTRETFSREDAWSCCLAIKTFEIFFELQFFKEF